MAAKPANPNEQQKGKSRKLKPAMQRYKDTGRCAINKHRNMATDERRQKRDALLRPVRGLLRAIGARTRLERRIRALPGNKAARPERARLQQSLAKAQDAVMVWETVNDDAALTRAAR